MNGENFLIKAAGITDVGLKREGNEDAYSLDNQLHLYLVADGMGGHLAGEVASKVAVELISKAFRRWSLDGTPEEEIYGQADPSLSLKGNYVLSGIRLANRVIHEMAAANDRYQGMGTTVAALVISPTLVIAANVGDSRIYLVREGKLEKLSPAPKKAEKIGVLSFLDGSKMGEVELRKKLTRIGKAKTSEVRLSGLFMGSTAATISRRPSGYTITFTGGLTKLKVNGEVVKGSMPLKDFDTIELGSYRFQFYQKEVE